MYGKFSKYNFYSKCGLISNFLIIRISAIYFFENKQLAFRIFQKFRELIHGF